MDRKSHDFFISFRLIEIQRCKCRRMETVIQQRNYFTWKDRAWNYASEEEARSKRSQNKTSNKQAAPDLRILSLYDDAAEGMNDFYLSLSLAVRQESWESSVAHVNASTVSWEYIFHVTQQSLLFHPRNCKLCVVVAPRFVSRF